MYVHLTALTSLCKPTDISLPAGYMWYEIIGRTQEWNARSQDVTCLRIGKNYHN